MGLVCHVCARVNGRDRVDAEERADRQKQKRCSIPRFFVGLVTRRRAKRAPTRGGMGSGIWTARADDGTSEIKSLEFVGLNRHRLSSHGKARPA